MTRTLKDEWCLDPQFVVKPVFFECENGDLIKTDRICGFVDGRNEVVTENVGFYLSDKDIERFKRFVKIHGVFGKEM